MVGIPENKDQIAQLKVKYQLGDYANFVENTIATAFDTVNVSHRDTLEVNGLHCQTVDMFAAVVSERAPLEVYYHISVFESADRFYQLIGWTHRERQAVFGEAAKEIDCSFHELPDRLVNQQTASSAHPKLR